MAEFPLKGTDDQFLDRDSSIAKPVLQPPLAGSSLFSCSGIRIQFAPTDAL